MSEEKDYERTYNEFWKGLVENPDGTLNIDAVKRELFDYHTALSEVPKVYMHITSYQLSKPNTRAEYIIEAAEANEESARAAGRREGFEAAREREIAERDLVRQGGEPVLRYTTRLRYATFADYEKAFPQGAEGEDDQKA